MRSLTSTIRHSAFFVLLMLICTPLSAQKIAIPGYKTLQRDFHMLAAFFDGAVWPSVRVDETTREELTSIILTEHVEGRRFAKGVTISRNTSHEVAKSVASAHKIILIRGHATTAGKLTLTASGTTVRETRSVTQ